MKHQTICGIYKVTNKENGKAYIGQSIDILTRWNQHLWHSEKDDLSFIFSNALKKYGKDGFIWEIIKEGKQEDLSKWEVYYIDLYKTYIGRDDCNGYNMTIGGDGYTGGTLPVDKYDLEGNYICSYVSISEAARVCNVHKTQITQCCKLNPKYHSAGKFQWRYKGDTPPEKYVYRKCLKVIQYTPSFEIVSIYNSCKDAHNKTGLAAAYIASCCHIDGVSALGYIWRFTE